MQYLVIEAGKTEKSYWKDLWVYRELFLFLAWRDILVRYKQTFIGFLWAILRPFLTMLVFVFVFGKLANLPSDGVPYPIVVFTGLLPWLFFSSAFSEAGNSLIANSNMLSKVYFPRLIIPVSTIIVCFVDFFISVIILVGLMFWYGVFPTIKILIVPVFVMMLFLFALGAGVWVAALNVKYRDFRFVIPFIVQIGMYISPVGFSSSIVPDHWRIIYSLNPMVGIIDGFRWVIIGGEKIYFPGLLLSISIITITLVFGLYYFRSTERKIADII